MEGKKANGLSVIIGILGVGLIALSIVLFTTENAGEIFRSFVTSILQIDLGLLLLIYGIKENRTKGKQKGNMYFVIGLAILTSTIYTVYDLFLKLAQ